MGQINVLNVFGHQFHSQSEFPGFIYLLYLVDKIDQWRIRVQVVHLNPPLKKLKKIIF